MTSPSATHELWILVDRHPDGVDAYPVEIEALTALPEPEAVIESVWAPGIEIERYEVPRAFDNEYQWWGPFPPPWRPPVTCMVCGKPCTVEAVGSDGLEGHHLMTPFGDERDEDRDDHHDAQPNRGRRDA